MLSFRFFLSRHLVPVVLPPFASHADVQTKTEPSLEREEDAALLYWLQRTSHLSVSEGGESESFLTRHALGANLTLSV